MKGQIALGSVRIDPVEYAIQGNAVLGIRDSGKSYTASYMAERLMDAKIPFTAFDPIGVWRWLRVPGKGPGYPVVVAGGESPDLPLTPQGAPEIVRAAMREGVSIVIDLFSMKLSKADWRRIVEGAVRTLLYENKQHGLRHVFIEEAAEFVPQNLRSTSSDNIGAVYAEVEKLVRMGRNAGLGCTLINPRAEGVNKEVLELCDMLFLHRQRGRRSLENVGKWLDMADAQGAKEIRASLSTLGQGDCWVWAAGSDTPVRVHIPQKQTYHPNPRELRGEAAAPKDTTDVSAFVLHMESTLSRLVEEATANDPRRLKAKIAELERALKAATDLRKTTPDQTAIKEAEQRGYERGKAEGHLDGMTEIVRLIRPAVEKGNALIAAGAELAAALREIAPALAAPPPRLPDSAVKPTPAKPTPAKRPAPLPDSAIAHGNGEDRSLDLLPAHRRILNALAEFEALGFSSVSRTQLGFWVGLRANTGNFGNYLGALRSAGLIEYPDAGMVALTDRGRAATAPVAGPPDTTELHRRVREKLPPALWRILETVIAVYPDALTREEIGDAVGLKANTGNFGNYLGSLRTLGLIDYPAPGQVTAQPVLFIDG